MRSKRLRVGISPKAEGVPQEAQNVDVAAEDDDAAIPRTPTSLQVRTGAEEEEDPHAQKADAATEADILCKRAHVH